LKLLNKWQEISLIFTPCTNDLQTNQNKPNRNFLFPIFKNPHISNNGRIVFSKHKQQ